MYTLEVTNFQEAEHIELVPLLLLGRPQDIIVGHSFFSFLFFSFLFFLLFYNSIKFRFEIVLLKDARELGAREDRRICAAMS